MMAAYHQVRFTYDPRRDAVWREICSYLQRWVRSEEPLLELGAGYGEFSRHIRAAKKWALDQNPELANYWPDCVNPLIQSALEPWAIPHAGTVFASNFFEHFTLDQSEIILSQVRKVLPPGGRLICVQPNFRLQPRRYFDDYTHRTAFTDRGFGDFLQAEGFRVIHSEPRFLPFSMKSRLPVAGWLVRLYLSLPMRPIAGQFLVVAEKRDSL